jgi:hypothetical protein
MVMKDLIAGEDVRRAGRLLPRSCPGSARR